MYLLPARVATDMIVSVADYEALCAKVTASNQDSQNAFEVLCRVKDALALSERKRIDSEQDLRASKAIIAQAADSAEAASLRSLEELKDVREALSKSLDSQSAALKQKVRELQEEIQTLHAAARAQAPAEARGQQSESTALDDLQEEVVSLRAIVASREEERGEILKTLSSNDRKVRQHKADLVSAQAELAATRGHVDTYVSALCFHWKLKPQPQDQDVCRQLTKFSKRLNGVFEDMREARDDALKLLAKSAQGSPPVGKSAKRAAPAGGKPPKKRSKTVPVVETSTCVVCAAEGDDETMQLCDRCEAQACLTCCPPGKTFHCVTCRGDTLASVEGFYEVDPDRLWGDANFQDLSQAERGANVVAYPHEIPGDVLLSAKGWKSRLRVRSFLNVAVTWQSGGSTVETFGELMDHHGEKMLALLPPLLSQSARDSAEPGNELFFRSLVAQHLPRK